MQVTWKGAARQNIGSVVIGPTVHTGARFLPRLSSASTVLIASGTALLLLTLVAVTAGIWQLRKDALNEAERSLAGLGTAIAEQTTRSMQGADLVLEELRREFEAHGWTSPEQFRAGLATEAVFRQLAARADILPQVNAFTVIGADGKLVNFSRGWPIPPTDLSDRSYFQRLQRENVGHSIITLPMRNRGDGGMTAYIVRRVNGPGGQFLGLVLAALDLNYFRDFYRLLVKDGGNGVELLRRDGVALTSYPRPLDAASDEPAGSLWFDIVQQGGGLFTTSETDTDAQLVSVHPLSAYPMVVDVTAKERTVLATWRRLSLIMILGSAIVTLLFCLLLRALRNQFGRLEYSEASLADQNKTLEATRLALEAQAEANRISQVILAEQSSALATTLGHMDQGILMVAQDGTVKVCNERAMKMLDLPEALVLSRPQFKTLVAYQTSIGEFRNEPGLAESARNLSRPGFAIMVNRPTSWERTRPNGTVLEILSIPLADGGMVRTFTDITERRRSEKQIRFLAHHDGLTRLVNRSMFTERLGAAIQVADREKQEIAVLYIDLDGFKLVNDTYGHGVGDRLLMAVADRLVPIVAPIDTVARMGGDEFAVIHPLTGDFATVEELAQRMIAAMMEPYRLGDLQCRVGLSIGIARYPAHAQNTEDLLRDADIALYRAKAAGKANYRVFDATMDEQRQELFRLEQDLGQAIAREELFLEYQPIVDVRTLQPMGFEALLRWRHPVHGLIGPGDFVGIAEASGLIVPIGAWVLRTACRHAAAWPGAVYLSVNLSPVQFSRGDLVVQVKEALAGSGLDPARLTLEITEGILLEDNDTVQRPMTTLRDLGVRFSLDDFGTAHSGLAYLQHFTFDVIKIDKSFVQVFVDQKGVRAIVAAVLAIGAAFSMQVVAEGVETEEQLASLRQMGCGLVQGYLTGRPATDVVFDRVDDPA